jgi:hypothetical protein
LDRDSGERGAGTGRLFLAASRTTAIKQDRPDLPLITVPWHVSLAKTEESSRYREPISASRWQLICQKLYGQIQQLDQHQVQWLAEQIYQGIRWLDQPMNAYCQATCPSCADPCCSALGIFFNQADLLYLSALKHVSLPIAQTRTEAHAMCRYLGTHGCLLARTQRPYVCVWFLCEPQMELFNAKPGSFQRQFINVLKNIRTCRLELESLFEECFPWT